MSGRPPRPISKHLRQIINKNVVDYLNKDNLLSDKQYKFRLPCSIADIPTDITHRMGGALHNTCITGTIISDILMAFHKGLIHKLPIYVKEFSKL